MIWRQYSSQSLNGQLPTTDSKRTKEGVPALSSFPGRFPEKMGEAGNALLQYLYLTFYIGSHFSITDTKGVRDTRSWLQCFSRTPRVSPGLTHFPAHYHISGCAESVYSYTICQTLPFIQWLPLPLTLLKTLFSGDRKWSWILSRYIFNNWISFWWYKRRGFFSENEMPHEGTFKFLYWPT